MVSTGSATTPSGSHK